MADTPLTLAETASVFGEMLTFRALLAAETDPAKRRVMLAGKVEDMLNTVIRQIAFVTFETRVHDERREAELTAERLCEIWLDIQRESLGRRCGSTIRTNGTGPTSRISSIRRFMSMPMRSAIAS